jgi:mannose-6-phosphate isomerase-like protein (cupin superfamily)
VAGLGNSDDVACTKTKAYRNIVTMEVKDKRKVVNVINTSSRFSLTRLTMTPLGQISTHSCMSYVVLACEAAHTDKFNHVLYVLQWEKYPESMV